MSTLLVSFKMHRNMINSVFLLNILICGRFFMKMPLLATIKEKTSVWKGIYKASCYGLAYEKIHKFKLR